MDRVKKVRCPYTFKGSDIGCCVCLSINHTDTCPGWIIEKDLHNSGEKSNKKE